MNNENGVFAAYSEMIREGEWAGWRISNADPFELHAGPFYFRQSADHGRQCAFRVARNHLNVGAVVHGGCLMAFADFSLFLIAHDELREAGAVTASFNSEFIDNAKEGDLIEAAGEVLRSTRSMVFVRGLISNGPRPLLSFSGILKKMRPREGSA